MKCSVIDIGSNSVRLLLWADGKTLYKKLCTTRLGEGLSKSGVLTGEAITRTANAVARFCEEAKQRGRNAYLRLRPRRSAALSTAPGSSPL